MTKIQLFKARCEARIQVAKAPIEVVYILYDECKKRIEFVNTKKGKKL